MRQPRTFRAPWLLAGALTTLVACSGDAPPAPAAEAPQPAPPATEKAAAPAATDKAKAPPSDTAKDPSFTLRLKPAGEYTAGQLGTLVLDLEPHAPYHVNQEFPMEVSLKAPAGVTLPKSQLQKGDAAEFGESKARFDVPFTPADKGEFLIEAHVRFAVCTPETCVPDERDLALSVAVK